MLPRNDYEQFKAELAAHPTQGDPIQGTGGVQKIRMRSANKGKSGGFRICYFYLMKGEVIYLLHIYSKNEQDDLTMQQKKALKALIHNLKEEEDYE